MYIKWCKCCTSSFNFFLKINLIYIIYKSKLFFIYIFFYFFSYNNKFRMFIIREKSFVRSFVFELLYSFKYKIVFCLFEKHTINIIFQTWKYKNNSYKYTYCSRLCMILIISFLFWEKNSNKQTNKQTNNNFHSFDDKCNYYF